MLPNFNRVLYVQRQQEEEQTRQEKIALRWSYYEGRHPAPLLVKPGQVDDNTIVNLAAIAVDEGNALLFGKPVTWQVDETGSQDTPVEIYLKEVWQANNQPILLQTIAQNGAIAGHAFVKLVPQPDVTLPSGGLMVKLVNLDPATVDTFCSINDISDIWRFRIEFTGADRDGNEIQIREDTERDGEPGTPTWVIRTYQRKPGQEWGQPSNVTVWPYTFPPIAHCQNLPAANQVWGYSDLEHATLNDAVNSVVSSSRKTIRRHGSPVTVFKNVQAPARMTDAVEVNGADGDVYNVEMQSDLTAARAFYAEMRAAYFSACRLPDMTTFAGNLGALTNFGLRVLFAGALNKTETKRTLYGGMIVEINRRLAILADKGDNVICTLQWPDPLPLNVMELAGEARIKQALAFISDETLASEMPGIDYAQEQKRLAQQQTAFTNPNAGNMPTPPVTANEPLKQ